jgi:hypothetical protein
VSHPQRREVLGIRWVALPRARQMLTPWQANLLAKIVDSTRTKAA